MKTITISSQSFKLVKQDKAVVQIRVDAQAQTKAEVQASLKKQGNEVFQQLKKVKAVEAHTVSQNIQPHYVRDEKNQAVQDGFTGQFVIGLVSYDFEVLNNTLESLSDNVIIHHIGTHVSTKTRTQAEADLTQEAIEAFKAKAQLVSKSFDFNGYALGEITVSEARDESRGGGIVFAASALSESVRAGHDEDESTMYVQPREERLSVYVNGTIVLTKEVL